MIKNFTIQKNNYKKSEKEPDYVLSIKVGENWERAGALWLKEGKNGKYFSGQLSERYVDHTDSKKTRKGWHIAEDVKREEGEAAPEEVPVDEASKIPF